MGGSNLKIPKDNFPLTRRGTASGNNLLPLPTSEGGLTLGYLSGSLNAILNIVASTGNAVILSRHSILVRNNEEASINVGSDEPTLGSVSNRTYSSSPTTTGTDYSSLLQDVQYRQTGITLKVTPRINDDGIINMKISQEVSKMGETRTTQNLQAFVQRKLETSVVVRDNNAIVMGGLIETKRDQTSQGIPVLKDIPIIGSTLFATNEQQESRTELVLIIVPQIVNPEIDNRPLVQDFIRRMQDTAALLNEEDIFVNELCFNKPNPLPPLSKNNISSSAETFHSSK